MKQIYRDNLRNSAKTKTREWEIRSRRCTHHIAAAVCFRETAESNRKATSGTILLPIIGFYYSLFHMGVAMLFVEYRTPLKNLKRVKHSQLERLIRVNLVDRNLLSRDYLVKLKEVRALREYTNYPFGDDNKIENGKVVDLNLKKEASCLYERTGIVFNQALDYVSCVANELRDIYDLLSYIQTALGDVIGEDLFNTYISETDTDRVVEYLVSRNLTT